MSKGNKLLDTQNKYSLNFLYSNSTNLDAIFRHPTPVNQEFLGEIYNGVTRSEEILQRVEILEH